MKLKLENLCTVIFYFSFIFYGLFFAAQAFSANNLIISKLNGFSPLITDDSDLTYFDKITEGATVIALGESTHGTKEFFQMKHRLIKYLVTHQGYTIIAMEQDMATTSLLNDYVLGGAGNPKELLMNTEMNRPYATEEVLDLIQWLREYNKTAKNKVQFFGFDMQSIKSPISISLRLISQIEDKELEAEINSIATKISFLQKEFYEIMIAASSGEPLDRLKPRAKIFIQNIMLQNKNIEQMLLQIIMHKKDFCEKIGNTNYEWLLQNLNLCHQFHKLLSTKIEDIFTMPIDCAVNLRDQYMAKNVFWIINHNINSKIILWAHSAHIESIPEIFEAQMHIGMGTYLKTKMKDKYRTIHFLTSDGTYTAVNFETKKWEFLPLQNPIDHTLEFMINNIAYPNSLINLRNKTDLPDFITRKILARGIGWEKENDQFEYQITNTSLAYDGLIYFKNTEGSNNFYLNGESLLCIKPA